MKILKVFICCFLFISCKNDSKNEPKDFIEEESNQDVFYEKIDLQDENLYEFSETDNFDWDIVFNKASEYRNVSIEYSEKEEIPYDFKEFALKFISDSLFQKNHIDFENLVAVGGNCDETLFFDENNWLFDNWNFIDNIKTNDAEENTFYMSSDSFFGQYMIKEVGIYRMIGFKKTNEKWLLTFYFIDNC